MINSSSKNLAAVKHFKSIMSMLLVAVMLFSLFPSGVFGMKTAYAQDVIVKAGDVLKYSISYNNPTSIQRQVVIVDNVPAHITVLNGTISNGGTLANGVITWTLNVPANGSGVVTFKAKMDHESADSTVTNAATVTVKKISSSSNERDVSMPVSTSTYVIRNPQIIGSAVHGTITNETTGTDRNMNVVRDSTQTFVYEPEEGYLLNTLTVDGVQQNIADHPDYYQFFKVQDDHTIDVVYARPTITKEVTPTSGLRTATDSVVYTIKVTNPTSATRTLNIVDTMPPYVAFAEMLESPLEFNARGVEENGTTVKFVLKLWGSIGPYQTMTIKYKGMPLYEAADSTQTNEAAYTLDPLPGSANEHPVTVKANTSISVVRNPKVIGTVVGGDLINSVTGGLSDENVHRASEESYTYHPNAGNLLSSIKVDGRDIDIVEYVNGYTFRNIHEDHTIDVVFAPPTAKKEVAVMESDSGTDNFAAGDRVRYTITVTNPTRTARALAIYDAAPEGTTLVDGSVSDNGVYDFAGKLRWDLTIGANSSKSVSFDVTINKEMAGENLYNAADVTVGIIEGSDSEEIISLKPEVTVPVVANPKIDTSVTGGTITDSMADLTRGSDPVIEYAPDDGNILKRITVDGAVVDPTNFMDSYTFANIQKDHTIDVVFGEPPVYKVIGYNASADIEGQLAPKSRFANDQLNYSIIIKNDSDITRTYDISDEVPQETDYVEGSASDGGVFSNGILTWNGIVLAPGETKVITFAAVLNYLSGGVTVTNTADVTVHKAETSVKEQNVTVHPSADAIVSENPTVTTSVVGGTITDTDLNIERGSDFWVDYYPNEGFLLESVTIDGVLQDPNSCPNSWVFNNIQENHTVDVVYLEPIATKTSEVKQSQSTTVPFAKDILSYEITYKNTTSQPRTVSISDPLPEGCTPIDGSISNGGTYDADTGTITWPDFNVPANGSGKVSFDMEIGSAQGGKNMENIANVTFSKLEASRHETDVTLHPSDVKEIQPNPRIETSVINGEITDTVESAPRGEDTAITYKPSRGALLKRITVDGNDVNIAASPDSYVFEQVQDDHVIEVEYVFPTAEKDSVIKQSNTDTNLYSVGDTITYSISINNDTPVDRTVVVTDQLNDAVGYVAGSASDGGEFEDGVITWEIVIPAHGSKTLTFDVILGNGAAKDDLKNTASVTFKKIVGSTYEEDVTVEPEDVKPVDRNPKIITEVVNGTITDDIEDIDKGSDQAVEYAPNNGYLLGRITVDGTEVDIAGNSAKYTFRDVQEDHTIKVEYVEPISEKLSSIKDATGPVEQYQVNDIVVYRIKAVNPTSADRVVEIIDNTPGFIEVDESTISDNGTLDGSVVKWTITVPKLSSKTVTFESRIVNSAALDDVSNTADVTFRKLDPNSSEEDVVQHPTVQFTVGQNPRIDTAVTGGTITASIPNAERGIDHTIVYTPNEGYILQKVYVDGTEVDIAQNADKYVFENLQDDHFISAIFVEPSLTKTAEIAENNAGLTQYAASDAVTYTITFQNTTSAERSMTITDKIPEGMQLVDGSISDGGSESNGTITWDVTVQALGTKLVSFNAVIGNELAEKTAVNKAVAAIHPLPSSSAGDVIAEAEVEIDVTKNPRIDTEIQHGTITDPIPSAPRGENTQIVYTPDDGYLVSKVIVDGAEVDPTATPNGYVFENVQTDHKIVVICAKPTAEKTVAVKESAAGGNGFVSGDTVTYSVTVVNETGIARKVSVSDTAPASVSVVNGSASDGGVTNGNVVTWEIELAAGEQKVLAFDAIVNHEAAGTTVNNEAQVTFHKMDGSDTEPDVVLNPSVDMPVKENPKITTEVVNGTITDSMEDIERGSSPVIEYKPNDGLQLKRILVDGAEVDITATPNEYIFQAIQADHEIRVEFEAPTAEKTATVKESENTEGGYAADDVITYAIIVSNPSTADREITVSDKIPEKMQLVDGSISDNGTEADGVISWTVTVPAGAKKEVSFDVRVDGTAGNETIRNVADVTVRKLNGSTIEEDVALEPVSEIEINKNPKLTTSVIGGTITEPNDNVPRGSDVVVEYVPNENYILKQVVVDGSPVDIAKYPDRYEFPGIQKNHDVSVEFVQPNVEKTAATKSAESGEQLDASETIVATGKTITYEITIENPTPVERLVSVIDHVPDGLKVVESSITSGGVLDGDTIKWNIRVHQNNVSKLHFDAVVDADVDMESITNVVDAIYHAIEGSENEKDATITAEVRTPVLPQPQKHAYDESGNLIDDGIIAEGETVTYVISVKNTSGLDKEFTVIDHVPACMDVDTASISDAGVLTESKTVKWTETILAGETKDFSFKATPNEYIAEGQPVRNIAAAIVDEATVQSNECDLFFAVQPQKRITSTSSDTVYADGTFDTALLPGSAMRFEILVTNPSSVEKVFNVFDKVPAYTSVVSIGELGEYVEADDSIRWELTIPARSSTIVSFDVVASEDSAGSIIRNTAKVTVDGKDFDSNEVTAPILVAPVKDLIDKNGNSLDGKPVKTGDTAVYTIKVTNPSNLDKEVIISDTLPAGVVCSKTNFGGTYNSKGNSIVWKLQLGPNEVRVLTADVTFSTDAYWLNREKITNGKAVSYVVKPLQNTASMEFDGTKMVSNTVKNEIKPNELKLFVTNNFKDHNKTISVTYKVCLPDLDGMKLKLTTSSGGMRDVYVLGGMLSTEILLKDNESFTLEGIPEGAAYTIDYVAVVNYTTEVTGTANGKLQKDENVDFTHSTNGGSWSGPRGKTGDESHIGMWKAMFALIGLALIAAVAYMIIKNKKARDNIVVSKGNAPKVKKEDEDKKEEKEEE